MLFGLYQAKKNKSDSITAFYGLNRGCSGYIGEFEDMQNMSSAEFPCAAAAGTLKKVFDTANVQALCVPMTHNNLVGFCGIREESFYYQGIKKSGNIRLNSTWKWQIVPYRRIYIINGFGQTKSLIYYYNTETDTFSRAGAYGDDLIVTAGINENGSFLATVRYGYDEIQNHTVTDIDGNVISNSMYFKKYTNNHAAAPAENIFEKILSIGDEVSISGFPTLEQNVGQVWSYKISTETLTEQKNQDFSFNNTIETDLYSTTDGLSNHEIAAAFVKSFDTRKISIQGVITYIHYIYFDLYDKNGDSTHFMEMSGDSMTLYCSGIVVAKRIHCFDNIAVHHGRLWGTTPAGNMIYASASDDIFSFTAADIASGYGARLTSDEPGSFSALCEYNGELLAFKPDSISIVYGTGTSNYNISVIHDTGCISGSSVAITNAGVMFLSHKGFYCYNGSMPVCISQYLMRDYINAVAQSNGEIYHVAAECNDGSKEWLTFDTVTGLWHRRGNDVPKGFFCYCGEIYALKDDAVYRCTLRDNGNVNWSFTTKRTSLGSFSNKALTEIWIRAELPEDSSFSVETSVDNKTFIPHGAYNTPGFNTFRVPVKALMGGNIRIRISGVGRIVIHGIELKIAAGGRRYKEFAGGNESVYK